MKGFVNVVSNSSLFIIGSLKVRVYVLIYVDGILLTRLDLCYVHSLIQDFNTKFSLKNLGELTFSMDKSTKKSDEVALDTI